MIKEKKLDSGRIIEHKRKLRTRKKRLTNRYTVPSSILGGMLLVTVASVVVLTGMATAASGADMGDSDRKPTANLVDESTQQPAVTENEKEKTEDALTGDTEPATENEGAQEVVSEKKYDLTDEVEILDVEYPYYVKVNRLANCVTVYTMDQQGRYSIPVKAMICSVGKNNNTPLGVFQTSDKYNWRPLYGDVYGQYAYRIHNAIMFHSVPYYTPNKDDLETEEYNKLGQAASLGCIRLACVDAKWLVDHCPKGTTVEIYDAEDPGPLGRPESIHIDTKSPNAGWDPTDPDVKNPWNPKEDTVAEKPQKQETTTDQEPQNQETLEEQKPEEEPVTPPWFEGDFSYTCKVGDSVNPAKLVTAYDYNGDELDVVVEDTLDTSYAQETDISVRATDDRGNVGRAKIHITVIADEKPMIDSYSKDILVKADDDLETVIRQNMQMSDGKYPSVDMKIHIENRSEIENAMRFGWFGSYETSVSVSDAKGNTSQSVIMYIQILR